MVTIYTVHVLRFTSCFNNVVLSDQN